MKSPTEAARRRLLTLEQAAAHLQWSVRTLKSKLRHHGIAAIGTGRLARLEPADL
jgi:hypothetical protein